MADFNEYKGVWVFCEQRQGALMSTDFELVSEARKLADELGCEVTGLLLGDNVEGIAKELGGYGADSIFLDELSHCQSGSKYCSIVCDLPAISRKLLETHYGSWSDIFLYDCAGIRLCCCNQLHRCICLSDRYLWQYTRFGGHKSFDVYDFTDRLPFEKYAEKRFDSETALADDCRYPHYIHCSNFANSALFWHYTEYGCGSHCCFSVY